MAKTYSLRFHGNITAVTDLAVSRPGDGFKDRDGEPQRLPRKGKKSAESPVLFPATSLRTGMRHAIFNVALRLQQRLSNTQQALTVDDIYLLTQGVDTSKRIDGEDLAGMIEVHGAVRAANPMLSLCGLWKRASRCGIGNAHPIGDGQHHYIVPGVRHNVMLRNPELTDFVTDASRVQDLIRADRAASAEIREIDAKIKSAKVMLRTAADPAVASQLREEIKELEEQRGLVKEDKEGSTNSIQSLFDGYEAIIAGTEMSHDMVLANTTSVEIGLFVAGLREFARWPFVGAHRAHGCGEISARYTVHIWEADADRSTPIAEISYNRDGFVVEELNGSTLLSDAVHDWLKVHADPAAHGFNLRRYLMEDSADQAPFKG